MRARAKAAGERQDKSSVLVHSPNSYNRQDWARSDRKLNSVWVSHVDGREPGARATACGLRGYTLAGIWVESGSVTPCSNVNITGSVLASEQTPSACFLSLHCLWVWYHCNVTFRNKLKFLPFHFARGFCRCGIPFCLNVGKILPVKSFGAVVLFVRKVTMTNPISSVSFTL